MPFYGAPAALADDSSSARSADVFDATIIQHCVVEGRHQHPCCPIDDIGAVTFSPMDYAACTSKEVCLTVAYLCPE